MTKNNSQPATRKGHARTRARREMPDQPDSAKILTSMFGSVGSPRWVPWPVLIVRRAQQHAWNCRPTCDQRFRPATTHAQSQARHPPLHGRRPQPPRDLDYKPTLEKMHDKPMPESPRLVAYRNCRPVLKASPQTTFKKWPAGIEIRTSSHTSRPWPTTCVTSR